MIVIDIFMPAQCFVRTLGALLLFEVYGTLENRFFVFLIIVKLGPV